LPRAHAGKGRFTAARAGQAPPSRYAIASGDSPGAAAGNGQG